MDDTTNERTGSGFVERLKGKTKQVAGTVLGDELLKTEGELHEKKADAVEQAAAAQSRAAAVAERAEHVARQQELDTERQALAAEEAAERRDERLEIQQQAEQARLESETASKEAELDRQAHAQKDAVSADERGAGRELSADLRNAEAIDADASRARATAEALDRAADAPS